MKFIRELLQYRRRKKSESFCMFDNMQKDNRLIINAQCDFEPFQSIALLHSRNICAPHLLRHLIKYHQRAPDHEEGGSCAYSYMRIVKIFYRNKTITFDLYNGDIVRLFKNKNFLEGPLDHRGFEFFNEHHTSHDLRFNRRIQITIPSVGNIVLNTQSRQINLNLDGDVQKSLTPANSRGALVSELCAHEIPKLSTILPLTKSQEEIDYANSILEKRWKKQINEREKWQQEDPKTRDKEPVRPKGESDKVDW